MTVLRNLIATFSDNLTPFSATIKIPGGNFANSIFQY